MPHTYKIDEEHLKLLKQIHSGIQIFEPFVRRSPELIEFQHLVERLLELERQGLIGRCFTRQQEINGRTYYQMCTVYSGLTAQGRKLLDELSD